MQDVLPLSITHHAFTHIGEISTFVHVNHQDEGIGKLLMTVSIDLARKIGFSKLQATTRADNLRALAYYQKQGFRIIGSAQRHALVNGNYIDEIFMELLLP